MDTPETMDGTEIAIVGMAGRFPGADDLDTFWQNLRDGVESIRRLDAAELRALGADPALLADPGFVPAAASLAGIESFDAAFFGYTPREAALMDPQHRLFLEAAWHALEHAGYDPAAFPGAIGVFAGATLSTYLLLNLAASPQFLHSLDPVQIDLANAGDYLTTRVSYKLDLHGPSHVIQSACSTSLVAVHVACQSLLNDECDLALAGGVSINLQQRAGYRYVEGSILAPDGHCRAFDAGATGTVFGSGLGLVVLRRLDDALRDGDTIYALIRGSAINNDGAVKVGYTAPSVGGQAAVISEALAAAGVEPQTIGYVETHGTGTPMGDPIEVQALTQAFRADTQEKQFCAIGSIKPNIGHLNAAAGVAGLIKTVLALTHRQIPPSLHCARPNPEIDFAGSPFYVNTTLRAWETDGGPRRAGVSSFGVGGTNAHVVLEEAPPLAPSSPARPWQLLLLSARTETALETATAQLREHLARHQQQALADVAYTLQTGRRGFDQRRAVVCRDHAEAIAALAGEAPARVLTGTVPPRTPAVGFLFPGQGAQYAGMGAELYRDEPLFRETVDRCCELLQPHLGLDLRDVLFDQRPTTNDQRPANGDKETRRQGDKETGEQEWSPNLQSPISNLQSPDEHEHAQSKIQTPRGHPKSKIDETWLAQPALFVVEYALARLWMRWGIKPVALLGHSIGEYVAACLAGVFSLEDALRLVAARGRLMQERPGGAMLAVPLAEAEVARLLDGELDLAAVNGPSQCVVAGPEEAIAALEARLAARDVDCRRLHTSHAFHSRLLEPIVAPFTELVRQVRLRPPQIPFVSNVTGTWITAAEATDPAYWGRQLRAAVRFGDGAQAVMAAAQVLLEVGPGRTLGTLARQQPQAAEALVQTSMRHPRDPQPDGAALQTALGALWLAGAAIDWAEVHGGARRRRVALPLYPFERERYWIEPAPLGETAPAQPAGADKQADLAAWFYLPTWKRALPPRDAEAAPPRRWLVFIDECGLGAGVAQRLREQRREVVGVVAGERFQQVEPGIYTVNPRLEADYIALFDDLSARHQMPDTILHFWSVTPDEGAAGAEGFERAQEAGFYSLLSLARALGDRESAGRLQIAVVANYLHDVTGDEPLCPEKVTVLGACRVIPQEYPRIACRSIDVVVPAVRTRRMARLIDQVVVETATASPDVTIAYRGNQRWVQSYEPVRLEGDAGPGARPRVDGVYVITGGFEGVGFGLAEHLARTARARLALVADPAFPASGEWDQWLATHDDRDETSRGIRKARALEEHGAEVLVIGADVADIDQMRAAIARTVERFGAIHGVAHAAGASGERIFRPIQELDRGACGWHFRPKAYGLFVLEQVLRGHALDFCLLDSSLAAVLGGLGYAAYAAANLFMDAFAHNHSRTDAVPWISVNWDAWQHEGESAQITAFNAGLAQLAITPQEGGEAFRRIASTHTIDQVVVSTGDLAARIDQWINKAGALHGHAQQPGSADSSPLHPRPKLQTPYVAPHGELEQRIARVWQKALGFEQIGAYDNFFDLGGDSFIAVQVISQLKKELHIDVPVVSLYERLTIRALADFVRAEQDRPAEQSDAPFDEQTERISRRRQFQQQQRSRKQGAEHDFPG